MWFSVVCMQSYPTMSTRHHNGQNDVESRGAAEWIHNIFDM